MEQLSWISGFGKELRVWDYRYQCIDEEYCTTYYGIGLDDTGDMDPQEDPAVAEDLPIV
ncbi:hypothetical protein M6B38_345230 [Iris pallida]|uniref:Uncharacterized protein n=1 Tax=Iris pallida TaxID=29817 RepID=A0AAX6GUQ0_IRIPA|nr:hypothetical protein M6B38_345230 [Iris pallida]